MEQNVLKNQDDFKQIYQEHKHTVYGIAINYTKNNTDANDILQEVFLKYYTTKKSFENSTHIKAWLIRVTINACKKHLLSFWKNRTVPLDDFVNLQSFPFEESLDADILRTVMSLPKNHRLVIHLFYYEGYSITEIARILNLKTNTVKVRLMRARKLLKQKLEEVWKDE